MTELTWLKAPSPDQKELLRKLWNTNYPASLELKTPEDFDKYLAGLSDVKHWAMLHLGTIPLWAVTFQREGETWFALIIDSDFQRLGLGSLQLDILKRHFETLNGWVIDHDTALRLNGEPYASPLAFYLKNNFGILPDERLETPAISAVKIRWQKA